MAHILITGPPLSEALPFLKGGLTLLVVSTVFASFLIPTTVLLFFFTPVRIWRTPLFIFNVLSIVLGLTLQTLYVYVIINTTLVRPLPSALVLMIVVMNFLVPICVQGILLVRLIGVYPPTRNTRKQNLAIYVPVVAFKMARLVNAAYAGRDLVDHTPDLSIITAAQIVWGSKFVKVEWFLQLFDDMFVSGLFVHRLYVSAMMKKEADIDTGHSGSDSWTERIRTLYYIAVSNFVFPILFNIAEIAVIFYDPNFFHGAIVVTVNCYVTIIGVLLATIWAQGSKRGKPARNRSRRHTTTVLASLEFAPRQVMSNAGREVVESTSAMRRGAAPAMRRGGQAPSGSIRGEKSVLFQSVGGSASTVTARGIIDSDKEIEGKKSTSNSGGATMDSEPGSICDPPSSRYGR
ncbi:hypothetical protein LXA43DRAFT_896767 [Ganoderma leucocontextum]|nr:hypothetical protein LXA43DRAFT_896767 [Ganoderma leucocontextum]